MNIFIKAKNWLVETLKRESIRQLGFIYSGRMITAVLRLVASIFLARKLGAEGIGILTIAAINMGLLARVLEMGLTTTMVRKLALYISQEDDQQAAAIFKRIFIFRVQVSGAMVVIGYFLAPHVAGWYYHNPALTLPLRLAVVGAFVFNVWNHIDGVLRALERFKQIAIIDVVSQTIRTLSIFILGYALFFLDVKSALICNIAQVAIAFIICSLVIPRRFFSIKPDRPYPLKDIFSYSGWMYLFSIIFMLFDRLDVLMLGYFKQENEVGIYAVAFTLIRPFEMIPETFNTVFLPKVSKFINKEEIFQYFKNTLKITGLVALLGIIAVVLARPVIVTFYGAEYAPSVRLFQILIGAFVLLTMLSPFTLAGHTINKPQLFVLMAGINLLLNFIGNLIFIPPYGATGAALVTLVSRVLGGIIGLVILVWFLKRWRGEKA
ncbi:MAG: flippase [Candidatus Krumholzibacteriota bacterium]|nr:flippase [Candidatus Krumholzibacteriota bacterium]